MPVLYCDHDKPVLPSSSCLSVDLFGNNYDEFLTVDTSLLSAGGAEATTASAISVVIATSFSHQSRRLDKSNHGIVLNDGRLVYYCVLW
jgi:hypothetical protein